MGILEIWKTTETDKHTFNVQINLRLVTNHRLRDSLPTQTILKFQSISGSSLGYIYFDLKSLNESIQTIAGYFWAIKFI